MALKEDIDNQYEKLVTRAEELDACLQAEPGEDSWSQKAFLVKEDAEERYWRIREELESGIAEWMHLLRKGMDTIPEAVRKTTEESRTDPGTGETYSVTLYNNKNFEAVMDFFNAIKRRIEGSQGILENIAEKRPIFAPLRNLRGKVLSFSTSLGLFIPENMVTIEQQVDVIFRLRDKGLEEVAIELEEIDSREDSITKCLKARTALEKVVSKYCESQGESPTRGFYTNLDLAINKGMTDKTQRKAIAGHYSFTSKIIHKEIEANARNTNFAITGVFNIISSLIQ